MNKSNNSLNNAHSGSSDRHKLEVSQEQRALVPLPTAYPLELTEEFQAAFGNDALVPLPASYRQDYWRKNTGDPHWQRVQEEAAVVFRQAEEKYTKDVAGLSLANEKIEAWNQKILDAHRIEAAEYAARVLSLEQEFDKELERRATEQARNDLEQALVDQASAISEAVEQTAILTRRDRTWSPQALSAKACLGLGIMLAFPLTIMSGEDSILLWWPSAWSALAYLFRSAANKDARVNFVKNLNDCRRTEERRKKMHIAGVKAPCEFRYCDKGIENYGYFQTVNYPLCFPQADPEYYKRNRSWSPFGVSYDPRDFETLPTFQEIIKWWSLLILYSLPFGIIIQALWGRQYDENFSGISEHVLSPDSERLRREHYMELLEAELARPEVIAYLKRSHPFSKEKPSRPAAPQLNLWTLFPLPSPPVREEPTYLQPPADCFDTEEMENVEYVFKGSQIYGRSQVMTLARAKLFAGEQLRPHYFFGGVPFTLSGGSLHMLIVGTTGSGKTTTMLRLMSSMLPLSRRQGELLAERLANGKTPYPETSHQWCRSLTHQAVVYNAKGEYLKFLEAFGFDSNVDLFNLDPADPQGYAWDIAADLNDRESIEKFAEQLIPKSTSADSENPQEFWAGTARTVIEAVINSLWNASRQAGKEPSWTLQDLVIATSSETLIKYILRWHDTPLLIFETIFGREAPQTSSVMITVTQHMKPFHLVANRWHEAKQRGRVISLKRWALEGARSVLVLPNTKDNVSAYEPLNRSLFKAMTDLWLKDEYSKYLDESGKRCTRRRYVFMDEFGQVGRLSELDRLMGEGRSFGVNVVLGLHQLSQIRETYGENVSETIVGLVSHRAYLRSDDPRTQEWMSKHIGNCLRSYEKESFSYSSSEGLVTTESENTSTGGSEGEGEQHNTATMRGKSDTEGSSSSPSGYVRNTAHTDSEQSTEGNSTTTQRSVNWTTATGKATAVNNTNTKSTSKTIELRGEPAIEPADFKFKDPEVTGECEGVYVTPTLPVWRTKLTKNQVQPEYAFPEKLNQSRVSRTLEEDHAATRSRVWDQDDLTRLYLDQTPPELSQLSIQILQNNLAAFNNETRPKAERPLLERLDDEEPLADFQFE